MIDTSKNVSYNPINFFYDVGADVKAFCSTHKCLCIATFGLAIVVYTVGDLINRAISIIQGRPSGTIKKTDDVAHSTLPPPKTTL